jgi:large subunit ribosomal protein L18
MNKLIARKRRGTKGRRKIQELEAVRLCVHRTPKHIYAQIYSSDGGCVLAAATSVEKLVKEQALKPGKILTAEVVGKLIAARALEKGVKRVAFDRSGFLYHGRIKALADAARAAGLEF